MVNSQLKIVSVTKHLCITYPETYKDIFKTILIVCKIPSRQHCDYLNDNKLNDKIQLFLESKKNVFKQLQQFLWYQLS